MSYSPSQLDSEARMYASEREDNFRWIARHFATRSSITLTDADLAPPELVQKISELGEFAEIAHGSIDPYFVFSYRKHLTESGFPLDGYHALTQENDLDLVQIFKGKTAGLQGFVARRPKHNQIVVAFSGTSSPKQAFFDLWVWMVKWRPDKSPSSHSKSREEAKVHGGFFKIYEGLRGEVSKALADAIEKPASITTPFTLVLTAHSLGAAVACLFLLDILDRQHDGTDYSASDSTIPRLPEKTRIIIATFGLPRIGNRGLADHLRFLIQEYRSRYGADYIEELVVISENDGVPAVPTSKLGYTHMFHHPFYLHGGRLYQIPESESEHTLFNVASAEGASVPPKNPRGGHNYYNARDMERLQRRMKAILKDKVTTASDQIARSESVSPQPNTDNQPQRAMEWMQDYLTREEREAKQWESNTLRQKQPSGLIRRTSA